MSGYGFFAAKDIDGNKWPNWNIEQAVPEQALKVVRIFNRVFEDRRNLLYRGVAIKGIPLPEDTPYYLIHNERFFLSFTDLVMRRSRRCTNEYCQISLGYTENTGYPALTGQGLGRVLQVVNKNFKDLSKSAIYRLNVPKQLSLAALGFDEEDKIEQFDWWDEKQALYSPVPSRGREIRALTMGTGHGGGWAHSTEHGKYKRPTLRQLIKDYY